MLTQLSTLTKFPFLYGTPLQGGVEVEDDSALVSMPSLVGVEKGGVYTHLPTWRQTGLRNEGNIAVGQDISRVKMVQHSLHFSTARHGAGTMAVGPNPGDYAAENWQY